MKHSQPSLLIPPFAGALLGRLPAYPGSALLAAALNFALAPKLAPDVLQILRGRKLRVHVRDAQSKFDFLWNGRRFVPGRWEAQTIDMTIGASALDFLLLAQRRQDPDTLFFDRRLTMEGDTELGLVVKNTLDALDLPMLDLQRWLPEAVRSRLAALAQRLGAPAPAAAMPFGRRAGGAP
ncbi:MAG: SCP2 sterol-binding domain-containing protein [Burkholderiaceae bacterium]|jgi:predicted lipid carrier protein YhbT|nr:SCP2 sterol-binding domain-containing protein [Burkholderiaceae bacterium]